VLALTFDAALANVNYAEAFVFLEGRDAEDFCAMRWNADPRDLKLLGDPKEIMQEQAKMWAHSEVDYRMSSSQNPPGIILPHWDWHPGTRSLLLDLWIRGKFSDPIRTHCKASKSKALRSDVKTCLSLRQDLLRHEDI
jgi:hypothetical protein